MTSTNDEKDVKSNQTSGQKGKTYYIELYKSLDANLNTEASLSERVAHLGSAWRRVHTLCLHSAPSTHPHLLAWIQRHTARTVFQSEWQSPTCRDEHAKLEEAISDFIQECENAAIGRDGVVPPWESQLVARAQWFKGVLANPWEHPVLKALLDTKGQSVSSEEILEWLKEERGVVFAARVRQLALSKNCVDLALALLTPVMDRVRASRDLVPDCELADEEKETPESKATEPTFESILNSEAGFGEVWDLLKDMEYVLLHKCGRNDKVIDLAKVMPLGNGYQVVERLLIKLEVAPKEKRIWKNAKDVATLITQVMITRCMVVPRCSGTVKAVLYCMGRALVRAVPPDSIAHAAATLCAPASSARHLHTLAAAVYAQQSAESGELKPYVVELFVRAITSGMNELEKLKLKPEYAKKEARATEQTLASWFIQLGQLLSLSARMRCECTLTAFSVHPSDAMYERIKSAPPLPNRPIDIQPKLEQEINSEFGSWANDSRTQTNFVKTSETLHMQQTQHQANVLSTTILNEGEALGLDAELCQDIIVLLSGPRVKTLSWDMEREALLSNCRSYMERTEFGTRTLTTELLYLNLDPSNYQHLPEDTDDEGDLYYGIEKGYEHLVEIEPQPEEIWEDAFIDPERTTSAFSNYEDYEEETTVRKKKTKPASSDSDSDPLSLVAEKKEKKKERPHSKERSKERKKKTKDADKSKDVKEKDKEHAERRKDERKDKKKEKKERKKREKKEKKVKSPLVGMKVAKITLAEALSQNISVTDSDYDSQGKTEGIDENVLYDGQFSMDEIKSPDRTTQEAKGKSQQNQNNQSIIAARQKAATALQNAQATYMKEMGLNKPNTEVKTPVTQAKSTSGNHIPNMGRSNVSLREEVKKSISKLIEFRRNKMTDPSNSPPSTSSPSVCVPTSPQSLIGSKLTNTNTNVVYNKKQHELLTTMNSEARAFKAIFYPPSEQEASTSCSRVNLAYSRKVARNIPQPDFSAPSDEALNLSPQKPTNQTLNNTLNCYQASDLRSAPQPTRRTIQIDTTHLNSYERFLEDLQRNANAGLFTDEPLPAPKPVPTPSPKPKKKVIKPVSRVTPVVPHINTESNMAPTVVNGVKTENRPATQIQNVTTETGVSQATQTVVKQESMLSPQCAKPVVQAKKVENAPNTFARLSYMHKNKLNDKYKQQTDSTSALHSSISEELDRRIAELKSAKVKSVYTKIEYASTAPRVVNAAPAKPKEPPRVEVQKIESASSEHTFEQQHPLLTNILKNNSVTIKSSNDAQSASKPRNTQPKNTALTERDQQDLLRLLGQQNILNRPQSKTNSQPKFVNNQRYVNSSSSTESNKLSMNPVSLLSNQTITPKPMPVQNQTSVISKLNQTSIMSKLMPVQNQAVTIENKQRPQGQSDGTGFNFPVISNKTIMKTTAMVRNSLQKPPNQHCKTKQKAVKQINVAQNTVLEVNKEITKKYVPKPPVFVPKYNDDQQEQNWMKVLDSLRSHKTPSRGPNAIDMLFNKDSFEKVNERNQRINSPSPATRTNNTLKPAPPAPMSAQANSTIRQTECTKLSTTKPPVRIQKQIILKRNTVELPKKQNVAEAKKPVLPNPITLYPEVTKQSQPQELHKAADPFISGIPNSDYEILEELMDDDLRQEIEESYCAPAVPASEASKNNESLGSPKNLNMGKNVKKPDVSNILPQSKELSSLAPSVVNVNVKVKPQILSNEKVDILFCKNLIGSKIMRQEPTTKSSKFQSEVIYNVNNTLVSTNVTSTTTSSMMYNAAPSPPVQKMVIINPYGTTCNVNQSYVAVNNTPNVIYQRFTAPAPSQIIISNNYAPNVVTPAANVNVAFNNSPQSISPDVPVLHIPVTPIPTRPVQKNISKHNRPFIPENVRQPEATTDIQSGCIIKANNTQKADPNNANRVPTSIQQQTVLPKVDMVKTGERKVLSEVQEKLTTGNVETKAPEKIDLDGIKNQRSSFESEKNKEACRDQERLMKKRLSIIHREVSNHSLYPAIPLTYTPLIALQPVVETEESQSGLTNNIDNDPKLKDNTKMKPQITVNAKQKATLKVHTTHNTKDDEHKGSCRRILLRSSNKVESEIIVPKSIEGRKTKVKLKDEISTESQKFEDAVSAESQKFEQNKLSVVAETPVSDVKADLNKSVEQANNHSAPEVIDYLERKIEVAAKKPRKSRISKNLNKKIKKSKEKEVKSTTIIVQPDIKNNKQVSASQDTGNKSRTTEENERSASVTPQEIFDIENVILGAVISKTDEITEKKLTIENHNLTKATEIKGENIPNEPHHMNKNMMLEVSKDIIEIPSSPEICETNPLDQLKTKPSDYVKNYIDTKKIETAAKVRTDIIPKTKSDEESSLKTSSAKKQGNPVLNSEEISLNKGPAIYSDNNVLKPTSIENISLSTENKLTVTDKLNKLVDDIESAICAITESAISSPLLETLVDEEVAVKQMTDVKETNVSLHSYDTFAVASPPEIQNESITRTKGTQCIMKRQKTEPPPNMTVISKSPLPQSIKEQADIPEITTDLTNDAAPCNTETNTNTANTISDITPELSVNYQEPKVDASHFQIEKPSEIYHRDKETGSSESAKPVNTVITKESLMSVAIEKDQRPAFKLKPSEPEKLQQNENAMLFDKETNKVTTEVITLDDETEAKEIVERIDTKSQNKKAPVNTVRDRELVRCKLKEPATITEGHNELNVKSMKNKNTFTPPDDRPFLKSLFVDVDKGHISLSSESDFDLNKSKMANIKEPFTIHEDNTEPETDAVPQSYKDSIKIEEIPIIGNKNPFKRCVRIVLPNNKTFKATIQGKVNVSFDTLFEEPALKNILLSSLSEKKRYLVNVQQLSTTDHRVVDTKVQGIDICENRTPMETTDVVNLISDDEEEVYQTITTRSGSYKVKNIAKDTLKKHQEKLMQKCAINLHRCDRKRKTEVMVQALLEDLAITKPPPTEVIEIGDSSSEDESSQGKTDINALKDLLLKELGVTQFNSTNEQQDAAKTTFTNERPSRTRKSKYHRDRVSRTVSTEPGKRSSSQPKRSASSKTPREHFFSRGSAENSKQQNYSKIITRDCYIKLINCDNLVKEMREKAQAREDAMLTDDEVIACFSNDLPTMTRSGSFSILNELDSVDEPLVLRDEENSAVIRVFETIHALGKLPTSGKNSPVMEAFDIIVGLQNKRNSIETSQLSHRSESNICKSDWFKTKRDIHLQHLSYKTRTIDEIFKEILHNKHDISTDCETDAATDLSIADNENVQGDTFTVPRLMTIMSKYFEDNPIIYHIKPIASTDDPQKTPRKRKLQESAETASNKLTKNSNHLSNFHRVEVLKTAAENQQNVEALQTGKLNYKPASVTTNDIGLNIEPEDVVFLSTSKSSSPKTSSSLEANNESITFNHNLDESVMYNYIENRTEEKSYQENKDKDNNPCELKQPTDIILEESTCNHVSDGSKHNSEPEVKSAEILATEFEKELTIETILSTETNNKEQPGQDNCVKELTIETILSTEFSNMEQPGPVIIPKSEVCIVELPETATHFVPVEDKLDVLNKDSESNGSVETSVPHIVIKKTLSDDVTLMPGLNIVETLEIVLGHPKELEQPTERVLEESTYDHASDVSKHNSEPKVNPEETSIIEKMEQSNKKNELKEKSNIESIFSTETNNMENPGPDKCVAIPKSEPCIVELPESATHSVPNLDVSNEDPENNGALDTTLVINKTLSDDVIVVPKLNTVEPVQLEDITASTLQEKLGSEAIRKDDLSSTMVDDNSCETFVPSDSDDERLNKEPYLKTEHHLLGGSAIPEANVVESFDPVENSTCLFKEFQNIDGEEIKSHTFCEVPKLIKDTLVTNLDAIKSDTLEDSLVGPETTIISTTAFETIPLTSPNTGVNIEDKEEHDSAIASKVPALTTPMIPSTLIIDVSNADRDKIDHSIIPKDCATISYSVSDVTAPNDMIKEIPAENPEIVSENIGISSKVSEVTSMSPNAIFVKANNESIAQVDSFTYSDATIVTNIISGEETSTSSSILVEEMSSSNEQLSDTSSPETTTDRIYDIDKLPIQVTTIKQQSMLSSYVLIEDATSSKKVLALDDGKTTLEKCTTMSTSSTALLESVIAVTNAVQVKEQISPEESVVDSETTKPISTTVKDLLPNSNEYVQIVLPISPSTILEDNTSEMKEVPIVLSGESTGPEECNLDLEKNGEDLKNELHNKDVVESTDKGNVSAINAEKTISKLAEPVIATKNVSTELIVNHNDVQCNNVMSTIDTSIDMKTELRNIDGKHICPGICYSACTDNVNNIKENVAVSNDENSKPTEYTSDIDEPCERNDNNTEEVRFLGNEPVDQVQNSEGSLALICHETFNDSLVAKTTKSNKSDITLQATISSKIEEDYLDTKKVNNSSLACKSENHDDVGRADNNNTTSCDYQKEGTEIITKQEIIDTASIVPPSSAVTYCKNKTVDVDDSYVYKTEILVEVQDECNKSDKITKLPPEQDESQLVIADSIGLVLIGDGTDNKEIIVEKTIEEVDCDETIFENDATLVYKDNSGVILKGIEYEDPEIGTCYLFPLAKSSDDSGASEVLNSSVESTIEVIQEVEISTELEDTELKKELYEEQYLHVLKPKFTYSKRNLKRKSNMRDVTCSEKRSRRNSRSRESSEGRITQRKYRKGKNIDAPKLSATAIAESANVKDFKRRLDYYSSVGFSYSITFSTEFIDASELLHNWPVGGPIRDGIQEDEIDHALFIDLDKVEKPMGDPLRQTLVEEISADYNEADYPDSQTEETNFNMGFGEGSGRVIQNLDGGSISNFSAATLSDVKHTQPCLLSEKYYKSVEKLCFLKPSKQELQTIKRYLTYVQLKDKVRSFFKNTTFELARDLEDNIKDSTDNYDATSFPFELFNSKCIEPFPIETVVQVVQVGQLPVSAAAQNPVTCDPRVTQVSDASPSQCSAENSPQDDTQPEIKTEYTELTTADLNLPMVDDYVHGNQTLPLDSQNSTNMMNTENIPIETELVKSEVKIELEEESTEEKEKENNESSVTNNHINNEDYLYDANNSNPSVDSEFQTLFDADKQDAPETVVQQKAHNGSSEKTDQIAHAMNAAGITTSSETANTRAQALVNILTQKLRQGAIATTPNSANNYPKATSINAMSLQQALASILPPPLNQTSSTENNQQGQNTVTPQVLHIVQGKNAARNQITLVDNTQQSVITAPNATPVLHIVQNKAATPGQNSNSSPAPQSNTFSGLSLVDAGLQQGGNQLLHIVNTGNQKNNNAGQLLKRVNLLTNLANVQGSNEQKMLQFVCKSADGKAIQLNAPHQRSMVLRLQPIESTNVPPVTPKPAETNQDLSPTQSATNSATNKDSASTQQEIKSRSVYEENYAKFIQNSSNKPTLLEKSNSLPKFNQAFGKAVFQDGNQKQSEMNSNSLPPVNTSTDNAECPANENAINLDHIGQISSPPLLLRKSPAAQTTQAPQNLVQQIKQTIAPMNIQTMHGGVIYTRQIPVNIGGGQTINLITVPSTELIDESGQKQQVNQGETIEPSIIKIVPQSQPPSNAEVSDEMNNDNAQQNTPQPQPVLTQMRIKLPMLSKTPQMVSGTRVVRPSFFQIQRNVIGGGNQVYQQLVLTAAPPLGQQTIRLPQAQTRQIKVPENQSSSESQMSSSTLEQLREFDMVLEQVKERSTVQPNSNSGSSFKLHTPSTDTTDSPVTATSTSAETTQVLYSIGSSQFVRRPDNPLEKEEEEPLNVTYVNRKPSVSTPTTSTFVRSPDSSGIADSPTSSSHSHNIPHTSASEASSSETTTHKPVKVSSKSKSKSKSSSHPPHSMKLNSVPPKTTTQKPLEDEQTTQRILYILAEYKEQVENSPDKDKPAPRRRSNPPSNPSGSSKRKKSSSGSRRSGRDISPIHGDDTCRTMGSEDSSCGTSQGDCTESCMDSHSPQDSPRKVARKLAFEQDPPTPTQPRPQPQRNVIVADGQTITVARGASGKPTTTVLMPTNYILPVSMMKGGQQIAIVTNRGPKLLTVGGGEGGATNALLLQRLIGPAGLKPVLTRPGVRHVRLPTAALHNLQAFNLASATNIQPPDSTASPAADPPQDLVDTNRADHSPWTDRESEIKPDRASSPDESEPWNLPSSADPHDYSYEETVRADNMDRTVLDPIQDRYSPDMEAQRIFDKMFDVDTKKSYIVDSPRCGYDIDASDCDDKPYQVVHRKDSSHRQTRLSHVSAAALRHKYAILEHELRLQKSLSEECEDLGVDSPSASELFPEAELLFAASPAQEHGPDTSQHSHTPQPTLLNQTVIQPDIDDQIATDQLLPRHNVPEGRPELDVNLGLEDVGIVTVSEDGMQATIALDQEEFARAHPNTTFHSEPTDDGVVQPFTISGLKSRQITSTIFHSNRAPATVLMTAPQATVISQATAETSQNPVKYSDIDNMIHSIPSTHNNNINLSSVLVKDDGLTRFDSILTDSRELHLSNTASAIVHSAGNATQVIRRVCYDDSKRERESFLMDEPEALIAGDDAKMIAEDSSRDATLESMAGDVDDDNSSPERHAELFWESNSASERSESRRPLEFSSDSEKCCKSPSYDETNSTDSSGVGTHMRLDSVIKEARGIERSGSAEGSSADDTHPPLRTYPPKRLYHNAEGEMERSLSGKTRAGERTPDLEVRRRASGRGVVKRGCHCCNGSPAPPRPKKPRQRKPTMDFTN